MDINNLPIPCDIPGYDGFIKIEPINKGVSLNKFRVETSGGKRLLLDLDDISDYGRRRKIFEVMGLAAAQGVPMCRPVGLGACNGGKNVYQLISWLDGEDLDRVLPQLPAAEQYAFGAKAGRILKKLHAVSAPEGTEDWYGRYTGIYEGRMYHGLKYDIPVNNRRFIAEYFEANKHLLKGRPQVLCHGDFHTGNLMVNGSELYLIDWNLMEYGDNYGDAWEDLNRILNQDLYPHYATGMLRGYFGGEPPAAFWDLFALYVSAASLMLVSWSFYFDRGKESNDECVQNVRNVLEWYDNMRNPLPTWYLKNY